MIADYTRVRVGAIEDASGILSVARAIHEENGVGQFDDDKVVSRIERALRRDNAVCGVIGETGYIECAVLLEIAQHWYSQDYAVFERFLCVLPDYRKSSNAKDLLAFSKHVADQVNLPLFCGVTSPNQLETKTIFYRKSLGGPSGILWIYEPEKRAS